MNFADLYAEFIPLRQSLRAFVGENALEEITVQVPKGNDEASFLRLIAWSYVLLFESGRTSIPYLIELPSEETETRARLHASRDLVHDLRTWSFHNLSFTDERELRISRRTARWFIENSGNSPPNNYDGWSACFVSLCSEVHTVVKHCRCALEMALASSDDGEQILEDLKRRLDRNWPAYRFDALVKDAVIRIGQNLDVPKFRQPRLVKWREYLETIPVGDDPEASLVRLIERDVLDHFGVVLPIDGNDVMRCLDLAPGPKVGEALIEARRLHRSGITDREELLARLVQSLGT